MASTLRDIGIGLAAGTAGGEALKRTAQLMWDNTDPKNRLREEAIEPRDPFIVLAQRVWPLFSGKNPTRAQEKKFETGVMTALGAGGGIAYVLLARRWPFGWLLGGTLFGAVFYLVEDEGMGPALGLAGDNRKYPVEAHVRGLVAHLAFGIVAAGVARLLGVKSERR
ncbi:MAG: DUF1440 domain-containing protein [Verrucomicrobiota bacterium]|jgi:hypothetical protein|nr:hypothetical protein [Chthoniobacterales bacterium]MDQ3626784.1 DUF1440 domain-containing protein [Verrucomicrobiota bacterium]